MFVFFYASAHINKPFLEMEEPKSRDYSVIIFLFSRTQSNSIEKLYILPAPYR